MMATLHPRLLFYCGVVVSAIFLLSPLMALCVELFQAVPQQLFAKVVPGPRRTLLLVNTLLFSLGSTALGLLIAIPAASLLMELKGQVGQAVRLLAVAPIAVPASLHAMAWQQWLLSLGVSSQGELFAYWLETLCRLPLLVAVAFIGMASLDPLVRDAARMHSGPVQTLYRVILPQTRSALLAGAALALLISLNEYGVSALFQRRSYALAVFTEYSATGSSGDALLIALPLILISVLLAAFALRSLSRLPARAGYFWKPVTIFQGPALYDAVRILAVAILGMQLIVPLMEMLWLLRRSGVPMGATMDTAGLVNSSMVAATAAVIALPVGCLLAEFFNGNRGRLLWWILLMSLAFPASLAGAGTILFWGWIGWDRLYDGWFLPVAGYLLRMIPLSTLLLYAVIRNCDSAAWDAARVHRGGIAPWLRVRLIQLWPGLLCSLFLGFALFFPELEMALLLSPPGSTPIGVKLYNYLHYGASGQVAGTAFLLLLTTLALGGLLIYLIVRFNARSTAVSMEARSP